MTHFNINESTEVRQFEIKGHWIIMPLDRPFEIFSLVCNQVVVRPLDQMMTNSALNASLPSS